MAESWVLNYREGQIQGPATAHSSKKQWLIAAKFSFDRGKSSTINHLFRVNYENSKTFDFSVIPRPPQDPSKTMALYAEDLGSEAESVTSLRSGTSRDSEAPAVVGTFQPLPSRPGKF